MVKRRPKASLTSQLCGRVPRVRPRAFPERTLVMSKKITIKAGSMRTNEPRSVGNIVTEVLQGWHPNTELGVDLKTILRSDVRMKTGKTYPGMLRRDSEAVVDEFRCHDPHYTFTETVPQTAGKRNPHVFDGKYITVTRRDDGSLRLNFKELPKGANFNLERFALGVYNELCLALGGLIEEGE